MSQETQIDELLEKIREKVWGGDLALLPALHVSPELLREHFEPYPIVSVEGVPNENRVRCRSCGEDATPEAIIVAGTFEHAAGCPRVPVIEAWWRATTGQAPE